MNPDHREMKTFLLGKDFEFPDDAKFDTTCQCTSTQHIRQHLSHHMKCIRTTYYYWVYRNDPEDRDIKPEKMREDLIFIRSTLSGSSPAGDRPNYDFIYSMIRKWHGVLHRTGEFNGNHESEFDSLSKEVNSLQVTTFELKQLKTHFDNGKLEKYGFLQLSSSELEELCDEMRKMREARNRFQLIIEKVVILLETYLECGRLIK